MRGRVALTITGLLAASAVSVSASAERPVGIRCAGNPHYVAKRVNINPAWDVVVRHGYKPCIQEGKPRSRPVSAQYVADARVPIPACEGPGVVDYFAITSYYWDKRGRNYRVNTIKLDCDSDGHSIKTLDVRDDTGLLASPLNKPARWRTHIKAVQRVWPDEERDPKGTLPFFDFTPWRAQ